jgi:ribosomal protein S18 acetylase RimI-like enzyme
VDDLSVNVRPACAEDGSAIKRLAVSTGLMTVDEAEGFASDVAAATGEETLWACATTGDGDVVGAAFCAREAFSDDVWNLLFIAVDPDAQGRGTGSRLLHYIEDQLVGTATALVIDTSGQDAFVATRSFYAKHDYRQVAVIPDYFGPGDSKVTFWRALRTSP